MNKYTYLDEERKKIWQRITDLEKQIKKKTPKIVSEITQHSKKASEFRNRCEESKVRTENYEVEVVGYKEQIKAISTELLALNEDLIPKIATIKSEHDHVVGNTDLYKSKASTLEELFDNIDNYKSQLEDLGGVLETGEETLAKITQTHKKINTSYSQIQEKYFEVFGGKEEDEDGNEVKIDGLVVELENSYSDIKEKLLNLSNKVDELIIQTQDKFNDKIDEFENIYSETHKRIENLLPNALTAGLSHAYEAKRQDEAKEEVIHTKRFTKAIWGLVSVSAIIFIVSVVQLCRGVELNDVILQMPRIVLAIMPLYIPVLWLAYSSGKKRNLSKRLIEEYTHKEVISKTFEGLSTQITQIDNSEISEDLRIRLLYNILEVTSSNPGKLISDYNKSDHPFMEALDQSTKLAKTVERISQIPGLSKLAEILTKKAEGIMEQKTEEAQRGLNAIDNEEKGNK